MAATLKVRVIPRARRTEVAGWREGALLVRLTAPPVEGAANKLKGIRCVVCSEPYTARLSRQHNNANMLAFGARVVGQDLALMIVDEFFAAEFEAGRHARRVDMIGEIETREGR